MSWFLSWSPLSGKLVAPVVEMQESLKDALSVLMLCTPSNCRQPFLCHLKMVAFEYFRVLSVSS